jgi:hypothetical protein
MLSATILLYFHEEEGFLKHNASLEYYLISVLNRKKRFIDIVRRSLSQVIVVNRLFETYGIDISLD